MKRVSGALAAFLYSTSALWGATLLPNGQQQFIDATGKPYANGKVYFYSNFPTCSVLKNTYQNEAGTVLNTNPVILSAAGTATIFGSGAYCQVLKDANNNTIWTKYTSDTSSASNLGWGGTSGGTANAQTVNVSAFSNVNGQTFYFVAGTTNTSATTLSVNGGSVIAIVKDTLAGVAQLSGGEIVAGEVNGVTYSSSTGQFHLITNNNTQAGYTGEVRSFAMASCPSGWLAADGSSQSATTYPNLAATLGTTWGVSAGNVVLPDLRGVFVRGAGTNSTVALAAGGNPSGTLGSTGYGGDTYLNHSHAVTDPGHTHTSQYPALSLQTLGGSTVNISYYTGGFVYPPTSTGYTGLTVNTSTTGGNTETAPAHAALMYCIKN